jgi:1-acyl-sn-glycerol-3-phosphate acyltransferase
LKLILLWVFYPLIRPFYLISLMLNTLVLSLVIIAISPLDRKGNVVHYIGKFWSFLNLYLPGTRVSIKGKEKIEKGRAYIVMSNHQSLLDPWVLIAKLPLQLRWLIRADVKNMPVFGYALERMGHIYVDSRKAKGITHSLEMAARKIGKGASVVIFPEGTRSKDGRLLKFRRGGAIVALGAGTPILPVTINGSRFVLPKGTLALMPGKIQVLVGDVIDPQAFGHERKEALMEAVRSAIERNLDLEYGAFTS